MVIIFPKKFDASNPGADGWRARLEMARKWRDTVNKYRGDVTVIHLPEIGIKGNTHFPFSDLNNIQIADLLSKWLKEKDWIKKIATKYQQMLIYF